jgi:hypothetical protein
MMNIVKTTTIGIKNNNMKTFKEYREKKKSINDSMETVFGSHSQPKPKKPAMETSFGKHSHPKGKVCEDVEKYPEPSKEEHARLHEKVASHASGLSMEQKEAVDDYTDESRGVNGVIHRHHQGYDTSKKTDEHNTIKHLDSMLNGKKTTEDTHVFTGLKSSPTKHFKKVKGVVPTVANVHLPAYTSTSTSLRTAKGFSELDSNFKDENHGIDGVNKHVLKIHMPKGTHAMSVKEHSFVPEENEIMLHRGHDIEIHHKPEKIGEDTYLWHAKIVGHSPADLSKPAEVS